MIFARKILGSSLLAGLVLFSASAAAAQTTILGGPSSMRGVSPCARQTVVVPRGKAATIEFTTDIREGNLTDPVTANVRSHTPRRWSILGLAAGQTDATFYDAFGNCSLRVDIRVEQDVSGLMDMIQRVLPSAKVHAQAANESIILTGLVNNSGEADKIVQIARSYVTRPDQILNMLAVTGRDQVMLSVRVVEVNRAIIKQLGFNTQAIFGQLGGDQFSIGNTPTYGINGGFQGGSSAGYIRNTTKQPVVSRELEVPQRVYDAATGTYHIEYSRKFYDVIDPTDLLSVPKDSIGSDRVNQATALIQAFERQGLVRTLAEPNLTTVSGEAAKFLAGGEYPVPSGRDSQGNTIIEFKPYGVGLGFTPVVLSDGRISLKISVEVSELSNQGALTLAGMGGTGTTAVIPALSVRRAESVIELPSGGSQAIAGLLQEQTRQNLDKVPGIGDVPILGALARSRDFLKNETELVIIVTAYLVAPGRPDQFQTPADGLQIASDAETNLLGRLNHAYKAPPADPATVLAGRSYQGPIGHVIE